MSQPVGIHQSREQSVSARERPTSRVFVSSPADVRPERLLAERVVQRLDREFSHHLRLETVMWEHEPLLASHHFQERITPPHETDIVVVILWSRLGLPLPHDKFPGPLSMAHFNLKSNPIFQGMGFPPFPHPQNAPAKL